MKLRYILPVALVVIGCSHPKGHPNSSTSTLPAHIVAGVPCYHDGPNGKTIFQMDPSIAKSLGGFIEVPCPAK